MPVMTTPLAPAADGAGKRKKLSTGMLAALWTVSNGRCYAPGCLIPVVLETGRRRGRGPTGPFGADRVVPISRLAYAGPNAEALTDVSECSRPAGTRSRESP
jgi:hypothetical protein